VSYIELYKRGKEALRALVEAAPEEDIKDDETQCWDESAHLSHDCRLKLKGEYNDRGPRLVATFDLGNKKSWPLRKDKTFNAEAIYREVRLRRKRAADNKRRSEEEQAEAKASFADLAPALRRLEIPEGVTLEAQEGYDRRACVRATVNGVKTFTGYSRGLDYNRRTGTVSGRFDLPKVSLATFMQVLAILQAEGENPQLRTSSDEG